jgi:hypothetical protein
LDLPTLDLRPGRIFYMRNGIFDIHFYVNGMLYRGSVQPSKKDNGNGQPMTFRVVLQNTSFGSLTFLGCKWSVNEKRPPELVEAIGKEIEKRYEL